MSFRFDKKSVNYLTTRLEHDQLFDQNARKCTIPPKMSEVSGFFPLTHTTGNGVIYVEGRLSINSNILVGDPILVLPTGQEVIKQGIYLVTVTFGTERIVETVEITDVNVLPVSLTRFLTGIQVAFDTLHYLSSS